MNDAELPRPMDKRPSNSNADEWLLFLQENQGNLPFLAVQIAEAIDEMRERCAQLHEQVNPGAEARD